MKYQESIQAMNNQNRMIRNGTQKKMSLKLFPGEFVEVELGFHEERAAILEFEAARLTLIFFGKAK